MTIQGHHLVDNTGTIYVADDSKKIYAINSAGTLLWSYTHNKDITGIALDANTSTLFVGDAKGRVSALAVNKKAKTLWRTSIGDGNVTSVLISDAAGASIVAVTDQGFVSSLNRDGGQSWITRLADAAPFRFSRLLQSDGTLYLAGENRWLYAIDQQGNFKFRQRTADQFTAEPVLTEDGIFFSGTADGTLYAINGDGMTRFQIDLSDKPITDVRLAPDGQVVYALMSNGTLVAVDIETGDQRWQHNSGTETKSGIAVEFDGSLHLVGNEGEYTILNALGTAINHFTLGVRVQPQPILGADARSRVYIAARNTLFAFALMPNTWEGQPDATPTGSPEVWQLANPVVIDIGADMLHTPQLPGGRPITGDGITVAVVDSGVQYGSDLQQTNSVRMQTQFLGQADFVVQTCPEVGGAPLGRQEEDHCFFQDGGNSQDEYGHGSHVAGIIRNHFQDAATGVSMGVAPGANLLSVRILDGMGIGSYANAVEGIQYVVANREKFNIRVLNLSISALAVTPYFVDPLNQAVERAWASGIVVLAAAGNEGPKSGSITVPGNDPYVITVGAIDSQRTPGYWQGDTLPTWSATGPTYDGFIKPDILAPGAHIVSTVPESATISQENPNNRVGDGLFRMSGTSMSTAVASGVVALMLDATPSLTPDQVKFRLASSARPSVSAEGFPTHNIFQQGMGRIWAPTAVLGAFPEGDVANLHMDIASDLSHGWIDADDRAHHYQGPVQRLLSDDDSTYLFVIAEGETIWGMGAINKDDARWVSWETLAAKKPVWQDLSTEDGIAWAGGLSLPAGMATWAGGMATWAGGMATWAGGMATWAGGMATWAGGMATWAGGMATWAGGMATWAGGMATWAGGMATWAGGMATWAGGMATWAGGMATWAGGINAQESILASTSWVNDDGTTAELQSNTVFNPTPEVPDRAIPWGRLHGHWWDTLLALRHQIGSQKVTIQVRRTGQKTGGIRQ